VSISRLAFAGRLTRFKIAFAVAALALLGCACASTSGGVSASPGLQLVTTSRSVTEYSYGGMVVLDLGAYLVDTTNAPFELRLKRPSYDDPILIDRVTWNGSGRAVQQPLQEGLVHDFYGLPGFLHVTITNAAGNRVADLGEIFCPDNSARRFLAHAQASSPYPASCSLNPFTRASIWGIPPGWGAYVDSAAVRLPPGRYSAVINVSEPYRTLFGISAEAKTLTLTIRRGVGAPPSAPPASGKIVKPYPAPSGPPRVPADLEPDLRALPAWGIGIQETSDGKHGGVTRDYLSFAATVWNAGASPLVVEGIRRSGTGLMNAYQYFLNPGGKQVGYSSVGTMYWDPRDGHQHWHFSDFARYSLLDANKRTVARSQKEGFCIADTDIIDYSVAHANWQPPNTSLRSACYGNAGKYSHTVLEILYPGSGDTYTQYKPGQSFDVTNLPNGIYYIEVSANPANLLYETTRNHTAALREVVLGGRPGHRSVSVSPVGLVISQ
jgi:hypothetical protein